MQHNPPHTFHIPVMGLSFTLDTPIKVAQYGISSVLSIVEDDLIERMREVICKNEELPFDAIPIQTFDYRAKRITAYLNLLHDIVDRQMHELQTANFSDSKLLNQYYELLPEGSEVKKLFLSLANLDGTIRQDAEAKLKNFLQAGSIDVNIMTKVDKLNYDKEGNTLPTEFSDALSALRGYALSKLHSSVVFSAGLNPRLFAYCENFDDFYPDENGYIKKKIILKVSDYRSAYIQGKYLAKRGLWISEFRVESGINCGGHAFISSGILFGPILEEFKNKRTELFEELRHECNTALANLNRYTLAKQPEFKITAQGGIGNAAENEFLLRYYELDSTGWGSPFLLVPEVTTVDEQTLSQLANAKKEDYYLSNASPLGVPFNNFKPSSSEQQRKLRIEKNRPGSPCYRKFLSFNTEFTEKPICTASREYQKKKIDQLQQTIHDQTTLQHEIEKLTEKDCLCEGLSASALIKNNAEIPHKLSAVSICPGPNLAYFSGVFTLTEMVDHIYGRRNILNKLSRSNLFVNELKMYMQYLVNESLIIGEDLAHKKEQQLQKFRDNLIEGINYYRTLSNKMETKARDLFQGMQNELKEIEKTLQSLPLKSSLRFI
ncbi:MAG: hypothetical protein IPI46_04295 [Bacteroidetes bacterium]|nr:hypothetical protein [Bacteroidota bacterium]